MTKHEAIYAIWGSPQAYIEATNALAKELSDAYDLPLQYSLPLNDTMSADNKLEVKINSPSLILLNEIGAWRAGLRERPAVRVQRDRVLSVLRSQPSTPDIEQVLNAVLAVPSQTQMWVEEASTDKIGDVHVATVTFRY